MKPHSTSKKFRKERISAYWNRTYRVYVRTKDHRYDILRPRPTSEIIELILHKSTRTGHSDVACGAKLLQFCIQLPLITIFEIYDEILIRRELKRPRPDFKPQDSFRRIERFYRPIG